MIILLSFQKLEWKFALRNLKKFPGFARLLKNGILFVGRRKTGEIYTPALKEIFPQRDWILTRIMWLSGVEVGKNRLHNVDTMRRFIYIHGTPDEVEIGKPGSKGCVRMRNKDIMDLYDLVPVSTPVIIR